MMSVTAGATLVGVMALTMMRSTLWLMDALPWGKSLDQKQARWIAGVVAISSALMFGFDRTVWQWACRPEPQALHTLLYFLAVASFFMWIWGHRRRRYLCAAVVFLSLTVATADMNAMQVTAVMAFPFFAGVFAVGIETNIKARKQAGTSTYPLITSPQTPSVGQNEMNEKPYQVHVIVYPMFGDRLRMIPAGEAVWIARTPANIPVYESAGKERQPGCGIEGFSSFTIDPTRSPEDWLISIIGTIDLHHGELSHDPSWSVINVIGTRWTERIQNDLAHFGFEEHEDTAEGFIARKKRPTTA